MTEQDFSSFSTTRRSAGYTLAEMAICLCIIGILMSGGLLGTSHYFKGEKTAQTRQNIDFVMNVLSTYAQTHYRLPCPADPKASPAQAGHEEAQCTAAGTNEGLVPWKELAIPQDTVVDGWGRSIIYKPASGLTADTQSAAMKDIAGTNALDVHNACRSALWYDADGNHLNRAKALFCCNAPPPSDNSTTTDQVVDAASLNAIEPAAGGNPASTKDPAFNGSFSIPRYMDGTAAPLLLASVPAVTGQPSPSTAPHSAEVPPRNTARLRSLRPALFRAGGLYATAIAKAGMAFLPEPPLGVSAVPVTIPGAMELCCLLLD